MSSKLEFKASEFEAVDARLDLSDEPRAKALFLVFRSLGTKPSVGSFDDRKIMQKQVFLIQKFGVPLGFDYGWYLSGPYSPELTRYYYDMASRQSEYESKTAGVRLSQKLLDAVDRFKRILGSDLANVDLLEAMSTVTYLRKPSMVEAKRLKPHVSPAVWKAATQKLQALRVAAD